ncbi:gamma-glutamyl-gamma-aminobutyrate hydrolase family protein [Snodgrassella communis]|uniref:gamma-glutamyl-gamma-aminobutyrate hydrolase n=1 Tax=Snodgrassella alvi TaxID=1196083 RepID=A0A2N9XIH4_9NEIS|nr:gamma-glutamyl-gamma-aminobutyrate hydrolase family protein [Snodgrassella communis]PIT48129.1 peptidase C26 [Snodgrassella communis]
MQLRPVIGIPCDVKQIGKLNFHAVGEKYIRAMQNCVGDVILLPALADQTVLQRLLTLVDGIFLPGSYSNIDPQWYGEAIIREGALQDPARDHTILPLIRQLIDIGIPLLGVCRGLQEINIALGGTLHQHLQEIPGFLDHREPANQPIEVQYDDAHVVNLHADSLLMRWLATDQQQHAVNSLHQQGVKTLAPGLSIEATAPDGLIEAFRIDAAPLFGYAVQWHPEWLYGQKPLSSAIFKAFREACMQYKLYKQKESF